MEGKSSSFAKARQDGHGEELPIGCATAFFRNFDHKVNGRPRPSLLPFSDISIEYASDNTDCRNRKLHMDDTSCNISWPVEFESSRIHGMDIQAQWISLASNISSPCDNIMPAVASPHIRESDNLVNHPSYSPGGASSDASATSVIVQSVTSASSTGGTDSDIQTSKLPVSLNQSSPTLSRHDTQVSLPLLSPVNTPDLHPYISTCARHSLDRPQLPLSRLPGTSVPPSPAYILAEPSRNEGESKSHSQVASLCDVVRIMSKGWIRGLALSSSIPQLCSEQYAYSLLELGVGVLRKYFRGMIPSSFQDIFALMHVGMASSYIAHEDDHTYSWDYFLAEACQWQHLLSDVIEKGVFVKAINRLSHPQGSTTSSSIQRSAINDTFLPSEYATLVHLIGELYSTCVNAGIQEDDDTSRQQFTADNERFILPEILQSNLIIKGCTDFLDSKSRFLTVLRLSDLIDPT